MNEQINERTNENTLCFDWENGNLSTLNINHLFFNHDDDDDDYEEIIH